MDKDKVSKPKQLSKVSKPKQLSITKYLSNDDNNEVPKEPTTSSEVQLPESLKRKGDSDIDDDEEIIKRPNDQLTPTAINEENFFREELIINNDMDAQEDILKPHDLCGENSKATEQQARQERTSSFTGGKSESTQQDSKPPPVYISTGSGIEIRDLTNEINNQPRSFLVNVKKDKQKTKVVTTESWDDYNKLINLLTHKQHHFHTYSSQESQLKFVLYGLPEMQINEVEKELQAVKIIPAKIVKMTMKQKSHEKDDDQNYLLYFKKENQIDRKGNMLETLRNVNYVNGFKVRWADYKIKRNGPSQCSRCLQFGHAQRSCHKQHICFRCSEKHDSNNCHYRGTNNKVPLEKLKCHYCNEKHTAFSLVCKVRLQIIEKWKAKSRSGNNRDQNKPTGHQSQFQAEQRKNNPPPAQKSFKQSNKPATTPQMQQNRNNELKPTTAGKTNQQNVPSTQKPAAQQNLSKNQRKRQRKNNKNRPKQNNNNQHLTQNRQETNQDVDAMNTSTSSSTNEVMSENTSSVNTEKHTSSTDVPAQCPSTSKSAAESLKAKIMHLLSELIKFVTQNPESMEYFQQTIGSVAKNTTSNHVL